MLKFDFDRSKINSNSKIANYLFQLPNGNSEKTLMACLESGS